MRTLSLPLGTRSFTVKVDPATAAPLDLRGSRISLETGLGLVTAYYLDAKPRRDAIVIPLDARQWRGGDPAPEAMRHARLLLESGVSVLLVDTRNRGGWRARLLRRSFDAIVRGALDYIVARGHDVSDCVVDRS